MKKFIVLLIVLPIIYVNFFSEKAQLDREVKRLCKIDGGITVYETVTLPAERFNKDGRIRILAKWLAKPDDEYFYIDGTHYIKRGNPDLVQYHSKVYRQSDEKLLGEIINYSRRGGDMPGPWHPSSFMCPKETNVDLEKQIFIKD